MMLSKAKIFLDTEKNWQKKGQGQRTMSILRPK